MNLRIWILALAAACGLAASTAHGFITINVKKPVGDRAEAKKAQSTADDSSAKKTPAAGEVVAANKPVVSPGEAKPAKGDPQSAAVAAVAKADIQDLVFCSEQGLYKVRLHVSVNGKSASTSWNAFLDKAFAYFDRNGDKMLDAKEVTTMLQPNAFLQGINFIFNGQTPAPRFAELDANKDGKIDREEFGTYFRRSGLGALQVNVQPPNAVAEQLTNALYKQLAPKGNGKMTQADLAAAWERLAVLDQDEDEIVSNQELLQQQYNPFYQQVEFADSAYPGMVRQQPAQRSASFISLTPGEPANASAAKILQVLQAAKVPYLNLTASRVSSKLPEFMRSGLRQIDVAVLTAFLERPPDLELNVQLGSIAEGVGRVLGRSGGAGVRVQATGRNSALEKATVVGDDGRLRLTLPGDMVEFVRSANNMYGDATSYYRQQFKTEAEAKKYMDKQQLRNSPQLQFLASIFDQADRNSDGKLFVDEFNAFLDLLQAGNVCQINVQVVDQGRGLFDLIDTNHDQRLSRRELVNAAKNFAGYDRNGDGFLERAELPRQLRLTVAQGNTFNQFGGFAVDAETGMMVPAGNRSTSNKGPAWFRKMDRNRDGDVSRREFLGTPEEFKKIDTDGDGLISAAEADKYQKLVSEKKDEKKAAAGP